MKKRLISILLLVTILFTQIPTEAIAFVGNKLNTVVSKVEEKKNLENIFIDVPEGSWYYDAVQYARMNKFFSGTSVNTFEPDGMMTRSMFVTVLGRMAGVDQTVYMGQSVFSDVAKDAYYAPYVAWASKHGITMGIGNGKFNPNGIINREQMAVFLVNYFEKFDVDYNTGLDITTIPADIDTVSLWARHAVLKLWKTGLLAGDGVNFNPTEIASRGQAATLCMRTDKSVKIWYREPGVPSSRASIDLDEKEKSETLDPSTESSSGSGSGGNSGDSSAGGNNTAYYKVTFVTDSKTEEQVYKKDTLLSTLPTPVQPTGKVFLGWYHDIERTKPVTGADKLTSNIRLYAKFADAMDLDMGGTLNYVSALDQKSNFSIIVKSNSKPEEGIDFKFRNITAPDKTPVVRVSEEDMLNTETVKVEASGSGVWTISAASGEFTFGHTYQIELLNDDVIYDDSTVFFGNLKENNNLYDITEVRFFNFSIENEGTLNLKLNKDIKYIEVDELNPRDGTRLMEYAGLYLATTDSEGVTTYTANSGSGSFTYTGEEDIQVEDTISVYKGTKPTERNPEKGTEYKTNNDDVIYVKITQIQGSTYYYTAAESEDVIFTPDVLPIDVDVDDGTEGWILDGSSVKIDNEKLEYFISQYENMSQNTNTTVDVGDYLAFYTGNFGQADAEDKAYGEILSITVEDDKTIIEYKEANESEVISAMDLYDETQLSKEEIEDVINENKEEIQEIVEAQIMESQFFDDAGEYLAGLALQTDEVREVFGDGLTMSDCIITYADGSPIGRDDLILMGNILDKEQDGKKPKVSVSITPKLSHFDQNLAGTGLRVEVAVNYTFKIQKSGSNKLMEVNLTAFFEQELIMGLSVSGGAVWKKKWIFPYIADYRMNGNLDLGTYTGIGITATAKLTEDKEPWGMPWPNSVNEAKATKKIFSLSESIREMMEEVETVFPEEEASASGGLAEKYAAFMEDANEDWVDLVKVDLINIRGAVDPLHILAYGIDIDFIVSANLNVAIGMTFQYENFKRHSFTLSVKSKSADSNTVDLSTNGYQFDFYVMGTLGIRAGIRAKATVGLFSTKLAGIGLQIEAGAYARMWGYFYYHLENWKIKGVWQKNSSYSGALLIEIGAYLDVKFIAEVLNGKYSYAPTIYAKEWPLWSAGQRENVYDFAYEEDPTYYILNVDTYAIPSMVYDMLWMDLKSGELEDGDKVNTKSFDSKKGSSKTNDPNEEYFAVELSNPNFIYNPVNNQITVNKSSGAVTQSCEMKITWKGAPLSGSSDVLSRTITLNWSNEVNGATIAFESKGGSAVQMLRLLAGTSITDKMPSEPTRLGYTFGGWYTDENFTNIFTAKTMPAGNTRLYAKWIPKTVSYTIEHYKEMLDGQYMLIEGENNLSGTVDAQTSAIPKIYEGFTEQTVKQKTITADGSTKVEIYYDRNFYDLKFDYGNNTVITLKIPYGANIEKPLNPFREGYVFNGWSKNIPYTMPAENLTFIAHWEAATGIYTVKHIKENLDGTYPASGDLVVTETLTGAIGDNTNAVAKNYIGFTAQTIMQKKIAEDSITVVEIKYARNIHNLIWDVNRGDTLKGEYTSGETKYGVTIIKPEDPTREGYNFGGWYKDVNMTMKLEEDATMPDMDLTLYAQWKGEEYTEYNIWVDGVQVTSANASNVLAGDTLNDGTVFYDAETNTLTLNGATLTKSIAETITYGKDTIIIRGEDLILNLIGENTITGVDSDASSYGIRCGNLTIKGEGSLTVVSGKGAGYSNDSSAILTDGNLIIESGTLNVTGERRGLYTFGGSLTIKGGTIKAQGGIRGIYSWEIVINQKNNIIMVGTTEADATEWDGNTSLTNYKYFYFEELTNNEQGDQDGSENSIESTDSGELKGIDDTEVVD